MINYINLYNKNDTSKKHSDINELNFISENIKLNNIDYYYSNAIARASKTMLDCRNSKINMKLTSTDI